MKNDEKEKNELKPYEKYDLKLLITEEDKMGKDISKMSDFLGLCINQQIAFISENTPTIVPPKFPVSDLGILNEIISGTKSYFNQGTNYVPDFERIPEEIRNKLKKGIYSIGESRKVDGNMRAVIVNEGGIRVSDVTLKKVVSSLDNAAAIRNLTQQIQMKNIQETLGGIQRVQDYQLDKDRDRDIIIPFQNARQYILIAQNSKEVSERKINLEKANDQLMKALSGIYADMTTTKKHLAQNSKRVLLKNQEEINKFISYLSNDIQFATQFTGIQMFVYNYLGKPEAAKTQLERFNYEMKILMTEKVGRSGLTAIELLQDNTIYNADNNDYWFNFQSKIIPLLESKNLLLNETQDTYIVTLEDPNDDETK